MNEVLGRCSGYQTQRACLSSACSVIVHPLPISASERMTHIVNDERKAAMAQGIRTRRIAETPIAVIDFETTGLSPGGDRVIELSVVRLQRGRRPELVMDTLINPQRRVAATHVHGITDNDVRHAPRFEDVAGELLDKLDGCVVAAYNVYFDIRFLEFEMQRAGVHHAPPHFCIMYLRRMLGLGATCKLHEACTAHGINFPETHVAADDAFAAACLLEQFIQEGLRQGIATFDDLARGSKHKFLQSFSRDPYPARLPHLQPKAMSLVSRSRP